MAASVFGQVTVTQFQSGGPVVADAWYISDVTAGGSASIVSLSGTGGNLENHQPLPTGAALLTTNNTTSAKAEVSTWADYGLASVILNQLTVGYSFFKPSGTDQPAAPAIKLVISAAGGTGDNYGALIYEPYWNTGGTVPVDDWVNVSINSSTGSGSDATGGWWWNGGFDISNGAGGPPLRSLSEWLTAFQTAGDADFANAHVIGLQVGVGTYNANQADYFDNVSIQVGNAPAKVYNFEVGAASVPDAGATVGLLLAGLMSLGLIARRRR